MKKEVIQRRIPLTQEVEGLGAIGRIFLKVLPSGSVQVGYNLERFGPLGSLNPSADGLKAIILPCGLQNSLDCAWFAVGEALCDEF